MTLGSFLDDVGIMLGSLWDQFGNILESFLVHFGILFGINLGSFLDNWHNFGIIVASG